MQLKFLLLFFFFRCFYLLVFSSSFFFFFFFFFVGEGRGARGGTHNISQWHILNAPPQILYTDSMRKYNTSTSTFHPYTLNTTDPAPPARTLGRLVLSSPMPHSGHHRNPYSPAKVAFLRFVTVYHRHDAWRHMIMLTTTEWLFTKVCEWPRGWCLSEWDT